MDKYAAVYFGIDESGDWRKFLHMMNGIGIISLSKEEIDRNLDEFIEGKVGAMNRLVLHGDDQVRMFENSMLAFLPKKEYKITDDPDDKAFAEWLERKSNDIVTP